MQSKATATITTTLGNGATLLRSESAMIAPKATQPAPSTAPNHPTSAKGRRVINIDAPMGMGAMAAMIVWLDAWLMVHMRSAIIIMMNTPIAENQDFSFLVNVKTNLLRWEFKPNLVYHS